MSNPRVSWKPTSDEWRKLDKDSLKFIFEQSDKYVKHTFDVSNRITDRAYALILFLFPLLSLCIVTLVIPTTREKFDAILLSWIFVAGAGISYCIYILLKVLFPRMFIPSGREPKTLIESNAIKNPKLENETKTKFLYITEITNNQGIIDYNEKQNSDRIEKLQLSFRVISFLLISSIVLLPIYLFITMCLF